MRFAATRQNPPNRSRDQPASHALERAVALHRLGMLDEAERLYRAIAATQPNHADAQHLLGILYYQQGHGAKALHFVSSALETQPTNFRAWSSLGLIHASLSQPEAALASYDRALTLNAEHAEALNNRGNTLAQLGRRAEALTSYNRALAVNPFYPEALNNRAAVLRELGRLDEALADCERALAAKPGYQDALNNRGNALRDLGRPEEALASYDRALAGKPDYVEALYNRGNALADLNRPREALASFDAALALRPGLAEALINRGGALEALGRPEEALASYDRALAVRPGDPVALNNHGNALRALGRPAAALASYERALAARPDYPAALNNRGNALRDLRRPEEALASYERAIGCSPAYAEALYNRGNALAELGRPAEALASFDSALAVRPDYAEALNNRAGVLRDLKRPDEALAFCERALAMRPAYVEALINRGNALTDLRRSEAALASYEMALAIDPAHAVAHDNRGIILTELGRLDEARQAIDAAIAAAPGRVRSYYNLAESRKLQLGDPHLAAMEALAHDVSSLDAVERIELDFALAKAYADCGEHERSFERLREGNALKRRRTIYDEAAALGVFARTRASVTRELILDRADAGDPSATPLFILGMPRSGTSLVEQILASHPAVFSAGEIDDFDRAAGALVGLGTGEASQRPEAAARLSRAQLRELGAAYLGRIRGVAPEAARITNKTPDNFRFVGLIHMALPNARIIHMRRDPVDTCLSCYSKLFVENQPFAYDLGELGRYYRGYDALMAHWRAALPPGVMLEVRYEDVVADLEGQARAILAHCGLEWDRRCLDFHLTERPVRTASVIQVRQPIYRSAVGRWRAYERFLGPLLAELAPLAGDARPTADR